jgi:RNA polymerase sigma-70 factor (ECF subfamily)
MDEEKDRLFEEVVLPYLDALYGFGLLLTGRSSEAEDLIQDTVLRAYRFFHHYQQGTNCKAWLFTIMKNIFLNQAPQRAREVLCPYPSGESDALWEDLMNQAQGSPDLRHEVFSKDIQKALGLLPNSFRLVVVLKDVEWFSYDEIAKLLDCPMGTVMSRLSRGRNLLRQYLQAYGDQSAEKHMESQNKRRDA